MGRIDILRFHRVEDLTTVITDASLQFDECDKHHVISFESLTETGSRYCLTKKEALAIVWAWNVSNTISWVKYLTDCKPLSFLT